MELTGIVRIFSCLDINPFTICVAWTDDILGASSEAAGHINIYSGSLIFHIAEHCFSLGLGFDCSAHQNSRVL